MESAIAKKKQAIHLFLSFKYIVCNLATYFLMFLCFYEKLSNSFLEGNRSLNCFFSDGYGDWSQSGCKLFKSNNGRHICKCNHLTNFAVLMVGPADDTVIPTIDTVTILSLILCEFAKSTPSLSTFVWDIGHLAGRRGRSAKFVCYQTKCSF